MKRTQKFGSAVWVVASLTVVGAQAQDVYQSESTNSQGMASQDLTAMQGQKIDVKQIFANTLAMAAVGTGTSVINGLVGALAGGISSWFSGSGRKKDKQETESQAGSSSPGGAQAARQSTGFTASSTGEIAAGLAYEVHAVLPDGRSEPIDPNNHGFRTGDRFVVFYRPTLPGKLEVYNINPRGEETFIETLDLAGGQLATMGPYEFTNTSGEERLKLVLQPCASPELIVGTRDIVKASVGENAGAESGNPALRLPACGLSTRGMRVRTRDIAKIQMEGTTAFALDTLSANELASGRIEGREVTITFKHE